jgi:spermidine synthase
MIEIYIITILLAFCSITYELLLANTLTIMTGDPIFWQSMTIGFFVGGLGLGAAMAQKRNLKSYRDLFRIELWLTFIGATSVLVLYLSHGAFRIFDFLNYVSADHYNSLYLQNHIILYSLFFMIIQSITFTIGILSGCEIPILFRILESKVQGNERASSNNKILALNYGGTLLGTLAFAYILKPYLDIFMTAIIAAFLNLLLCFYLYIRKKVPFTNKSLVALTGLFALIITLGINADSIEQKYIKTYYIFQKRIEGQNIDVKKFLGNMDDYPYVHRRRSLYQYIDIYHIEDRMEGVTDTIMALDTNFQFSTYNEKFYHEAFGHLPMMFTGLTPKKVLVLGGGDGLLIREILKHPEVESILHVELDEMVVKISKEEELFSKLNEGALSDPRVTTLINDGFYFLRNSNEQFDAIFIDFPHPKNYDLSRLYSIEFYTYVKKNLAPHGFAVLDAPIADRKNYNKKEFTGRPVLANDFTNSDRDNNSILVSTAYYAGFQKVFPYRVTEEAFILLTNREEVLNYNLRKSDAPYLTVLDDEHLIDITRQNFPYEIDRQFINSIFHPKIISDREF